MHLAIFLTLVWMQQEDEHGKMDYQHWPADLELPTAFLVYFYIIKYRCILCICIIIIIIILLLLFFYSYSRIKGQTQLHYYKNN